MFSGLLNALKRSRAEVVIGYDGTRAKVAKGKLTQSITNDVSDVLADHQAPPCEVHILPNGKVEFDNRVPAGAHQNIRNVIASR